MAFLPEGSCDDWWAIIHMMEVTHISRQVPFGHTAKVDKGFLVDNLAAAEGMHIDRPQKRLRNQIQQSTSHKLRRSAIPKLLLRMSMESSSCRWVRTFPLCNLASLWRFLGSDMWCKNLSTEHESIAATTANKQTSMTKMNGSYWASATVTTTATTRESTPCIFTVHIISRTTTSNMSCDIFLGIASIERYEHALLGYLSRLIGVSFSKTVDGIPSLLPLGI